MPPLLIPLIAVALVSVTAAWFAYQLGERRARRAAAELTAINEVGLELLRAELSVDELCELVYQQATRIVPSPFFQLGFFEGSAYRVQIRVRDGVRLDPSEVPEAARRGIVGWVYETGQPLLIQDYEIERERLPAFPDSGLEDPPRSGLFVPLLAGTRTIGVMSVQAREPGRFTDEHQRLLTALANLAAAAIRNAQLYEDARYRAEQLNLVGQVTAQVSSVQPLSDLFRQFVTLARTTFGYYCVSIFVLEGDEFGAGASTSRALENAMSDIKPGHGMVGWAARQGKPALANNVADDSRYRELGVLPETRSELSLPLKVEDRVLGVLDVQSDRVDAFSGEDVLMLETLAGQLALAIEQAQTYEAERQLARRLETLVQVSQAVVSILDLDDLLDRLVDLIVEMFGFERVHIFIRIGDTLVFRAGIGPHSVRWLIEEVAYGLDEKGLIPKAARTAEAERVGDVRESPDYRPGEGLEDTRSEMAIPIHMAGRVMGVLDIQSDQPDAFAEEDLILMRSLADSAAVAIRNAALYANERRRRNLADALREVSGTLASELDLADVVAEVLKGLRRVSTLNTAALLLFEPGADRVAAYALSAPGAEAVQQRQIPLDEFDALVEEGVEGAVRAIVGDLLSEAEDLPLITAPLTIGGELIGYVAAEQLYPWLPVDEDVELVTAFANQAAIAISNAHLYAAQQAEAYVTTVLLQVAEAVNAQAGADAALETIARLTALLAGVGCCLILRWDEDRQAFLVQAQYGVARERFERYVGSPILVREHPLLDLLSVTDQPLGAGEGHQLPVPEPIADLLSVSSVFCLPLNVKSGLAGLLIVDYPRTQENPRLLSILSGIAHQAATVLETASLQAGEAERRRLEQELEVARSIQASFIPKEAPDLPGWEFAAAWRAARQVSGDFYDFIPLPDGQWGLVIADVADKGTPAALFMAVCRTLLRAVAVNRVSPAETLKRVNQLLFNDARSDLFVTVFYAVLDPLTGYLTYASGGHNAALLVRASDRDVVTLKVDGIALGVIPRIDLDEKQVTLRPDDVLVAYTDGVTEAMQVDYTEWGVEHFCETLKRTAGRTAGGMMDAVLDAVDDFVGGAPQSDDLTIWMVRRTTTSPG
jgi:sigma-B regulation protein RsbU (phosphoserine phosphatase)